MALVASGFRAMYSRRPRQHRLVWGQWLQPRTLPRHPISRAALQEQLHSSSKSVTFVRSDFCDRYDLERGKRDAMHLLYARCLLSQMPSTCSGDTLPKQIKNELYLQNRFNNLAVWQGVVAMGSITGDRLVPDYGLRGVLRVPLCCISGTRDLDACDTQDVLIGPTDTFGANLQHTSPLLLEKKKSKNTPEEGKRTW